MIGDADDYRLWLVDGPFATEYRLDWNRRLYVTGYEADCANEWQATGCTSHSREGIQRIHELTGAVLARLEREQ